MSTAITAKRARMELEDVWFCYRALLELSHLPPPPLPPPLSATKRAHKGGESQDEAQGDLPVKPQSRCKEEGKAHCKTSAATPTAGSKTSRAAATSSTAARTALASSPPSSSSSSAKPQKSRNASELFKLKIQTILSNMAALTESVAHVQTQNEVLEGMIKQEMEKERVHKQAIERQQREEEQEVMVASSGDFSLSVSARDLDDAYKRQVEKVRLMDKKNDLLRDEIETLEEEIRQREKLAHIKQKSRRPAGRPGAGPRMPHASASSPRAAASQSKTEREESRTTRASPPPLRAERAAAEANAEALGSQSSLAAWTAWVAMRKEISSTAEWKMKIVSLLEAIQVDVNEIEKEESPAQDTLREVDGATINKGEGQRTNEHDVDEISQEALACAVSVKKCMKEQKQLIAEVEKAAARQRGRLKAMRHVSE